MPDSPDIRRGGAASSRSTRRAAHKARQAAAWRLAAIVGGSLALLVVAGAVIAAVLAPESTTPAAPAQAASLETTAPASEPATVSAEPTASIEPTPSLPPTITVAAVGDIIFDRNVAKLIAAEGGTAPLADVAEQLARADVTVGNLESPVSERGTRVTGKEYTFRGDPRGVEGLVYAGFDAVSLANNHTLDYGPDALADTISSLDARGIAYSGAGADKAAAWQAAVIEVGDATVAYLAFSHILPPGFIATDSKPGVAQGRNNMREVQRAIGAAKKRHDYVIVSFHWGVEKVDDANAEQVRDARLAVDAGADMVMAHHPHVIQGVERYKDSLIAYSLGDFVFDHYSRKTGEAFILDMQLGPFGVGETTVTPVYLDTYGKPEYVSGPEASVILERLKLVSAKHDTIVEIDGDIGTVR